MLGFAMFVVWKEKSVFIGQNTMEFGKLFIGLKICGE